LNATDLGREIIGDQQMLHNGALILAGMSAWIW